MASTIIRAPETGHPPARREYMHVPLAAFCLEDAVEVDLFYWPRGVDYPSLYRSARIPITESDVAELKRRGHHSLYVHHAEFARLESHLRLALEHILADASLDPAERFAVLQTAVAVEMDAAFRMIKCDRFVAMAQRVAGQITTLLDGNAVVPKQLFDMVQHDFYTFTHLTNVAGFAVLLADQLGVANAVERGKIAVGALLHDVGKRFIPATVLCKTGKLTGEEWDMIKAHPQRGYEDLCERDDLDFGQLMMVYQHHERLDGAGYPVGMISDGIHPWAKLLAIVDVFDALTSARPYRSPMKSAEALLYLEKHAGSQFDREMVKCWKAAMQLR